ncbi:MAG: hypothetical protein LV473_10710 [Nitrospira sp.]|nr:hypothetical protein [Nitrospira sp.]
MSRLSGIIIALAMALSGCQHTGFGERYGTPTITRTGEVKEIIIRDDDVSPAIVTAHPGDEIRWINRQQDEARVIFLLPMEGQLSCQRGFGGLMSANKNQYTAKLRANETASVCFKHPSEIKYVVRANSTLSNGEEHIAGTINISGRQGPSNKEDGGKRAQSSQ